MFKQVFLPILGVIVFITVVGYFSQKSSSLKFDGILPRPTPSQKMVTIGSTTIKSEVADTAAARTQGLSGVTSLDAGSGMLFVFDTKDVNPIFWMKDMLITLDIIWINDGKIVRIDKNVPKPLTNTPDIKLKTYSAGQPIDYVLEVNAGFSDSNSIKVGDTVTIP